MKKILFFVGILCMQTTHGYQELVKEQFESKDTNYIKVILDGTHEIHTIISDNGDTLEDLVSKAGGISGVNGAYFCPADYKNCGGINYSENARIVDGVSYAKYKDDLGSSGLFGFDMQGKPLFILNNFGYVDGIKRQYNEKKLKDMKYGIANFPVLLLEGENVIDESKNILEYKQTSPGIKSFICSENDARTIKMGTVSNITVQELASYLQKNLNCYNAINLDSGASLGMVYNGETLKKPGRKIMDAFVVVETGKTPEPVKTEKKENKLLTLVYKKIDTLLTQKPDFKDTLLKKIGMMKKKLLRTSQKYILLSEIENYLKIK